MFEKFISATRMGGFTRAWLIPISVLPHLLSLSLLDDLQDFMQVVKNASISEFELLATHRGISAKVSSSSTKSGILYTISSEIHLKIPSKMRIVPFSDFVLLAEKSNSDVVLFGTPEYPLQVQKEPVLSAEASGSEGEMLRISGTTPTYPKLMTNKFYK